MKKISILGTIILASALSVGCASIGDNSFQTSGAMIGGLTGGLIGGRVGDGYGNVAATIGGTMLGTHIGKSIGRSADRQPQYPTIPQHQIFHSQMPSVTVQPTTTPMSYPNCER